MGVVQREQGKKALFPWFKTPNLDRIAAAEVPLLVRYPPLAKPGTVIRPMVLSLDLAPSVLDLCDVVPLLDADGRSWKPLLEGKSAGWRTAFFYQYNYEPQFPYTPNVRAVRTEDWKYIHYPHGDGSPDRYTSDHSSWRYFKRTMSEQTGQRKSAFNGGPLLFLSLRALPLAPTIR